MKKTNRLSEDFSIHKIGSGSFYKKGATGGKFQRGLLGALGRSRKKNLTARTISNQDMETFSELVGGELRKLNKSSEGLPWQARRRIMSRAEQLRKEGKISAVDKKDLRKIVTALGINAQDLAEDSQPLKRAVEFGGSNRISEPIEQGQADVSLGALPNTTSNDIELSRLRKTIDAIGSNKFGRNDGSNFGQSRDSQSQAGIKIDGDENDDEKNENDLTDPIAVAKKAAEELPDPTL